MARSYRDLLVWQKAKKLAIEVYRATEGFPRSELYGLTSQMRRAAVSVASNVAEGQGRLTPGEFQHFLGNSRGSLLELETQLDIAHELGYLNHSQYRSLEQECYRVPRTHGPLNRISQGQTESPSWFLETLKP